MASKNSNNRLTLSFLAFSQIGKMKSADRIKKILDIILSNRIVILQGRLSSVEEASLIQSTMALAGRIKKFKGVELAVVQPNQNSSIFDKMKTGLARALVGEMDVLTIIGPAAVVKDIKKNPEKIDLMLKR